MRLKSIPIEDVVVKVLDALIEQPLAIIAAFAAAVWTLYKWHIERPKDRAALILLQKDVEAARAMPVLRYSFTVTSRTICDSLFLEIRCDVHNAGVRKAVCDLRHEDLLTVVPITSTNGEVSYGHPIFSSLPTVRERAVTKWSWRMLAPGATDIYNFLVPIPSAGVYFVELKIVPGKGQDLPYRDEKEHYDESIPLFWAGSTYTEVE